jgi:hypothetical protein
VLYTRLILEEIINAYSTSLIGYKPRFLPGLSTIIFYYVLLLIYINYILIPSLPLIPELIKPLFLTTLLLSPNLFRLSIIN